jgi:hypothetical protein
VGRATVFLDLIHQLFLAVGRGAPVAFVADVTAGEGVARVIAFLDSLMREFANVCHECLPIRILPKIVS